METARAAIEELVHRETRAWDTQDVELLLSLFHPDMVWPWPPHADAHDPIEWVIVWGRFDRERWGRGWQALFDSHELVHNRRAPSPHRSQRRSRWRVCRGGRGHALAAPGGRPRPALAGTSVQALHSTGQWRMEDDRAYRITQI